MIKSKKPLPHHLSDFLDWLDIEKGLSSKTQENYTRFLKIFFDWLKINKLENLKPHQLSPTHIWNFKVFLSRKYLSKIKKPLSRATQNYYLIALRSFLTYFTERNILSLPPEKVKLAKKTQEREVRFLTLKQIEKLFSIPDTRKIIGLRDRAILEVLFSTGMRIGELVNLNKDQIKFDEKIKDLEISILGKGGRRRTVYLSERALYWLKKYLKERNDKEKALFINFRAKKGSSRRLTGRYIEKMIKKYALLAGLPPDTTPHVLRHSFATDLLSQGVDLRVVQEFLGHKNISATQIYTHITHHQLKEIHQRFHSGKRLRV